jgi:hypothetical protein
MPLTAAQLAERERLRRAKRIDLLGEDANFSPDFDSKSFNKTLKAEERAANAIKKAELKNDEDDKSIGSRFNLAQAASIGVPAAYSLANFLSQKKGRFHAKYDPVNLQTRTVSRPLTPNFTVSTRPQGSSLTDRDFIFSYNRRMDELRKQQFEQGADASVNAQLDRNNQITNQGILVNSQKKDMTEQGKYAVKNMQQERIESAANTALGDAVYNASNIYNQKQQTRGMLASHYIESKLKDVNYTGSYQDLLKEMGYKNTFG